MPIPAPYPTSHQNSPDQNSPNQNSPNQNRTSS
jgi:hypothetical protein